MWTPEEIALKIGNGIKTIRLQRNIDRQTLSKRAGIGINSLTRLENGQGVSLITLIKIIISLDKQDWALSLAPYISINPLDSLLKRGKQRQRASRVGKVKSGLEHKRAHLMQSYGLTLDQFVKMFDFQKGLCGNSGCKNTLNLQSRETHVDHNHKTGKIRSLLCSGCNSALGMLKEDRGRAAGLIEYIKKHNE